MNYTFEEIKLSGTTTAGGALTVNATKSAVGFLYAVEWIDGTFDNGVGAVISVEGTASGVSQTLLTLTNANDDKWYYPRMVTHGNTGADLTDYAMPFLNGVPRLVVSAGGNAKTGGCVLYYYQ